MSQVGLSKSKYAAYCQCPKLLWLSQQNWTTSTSLPAIPQFKGTKPYESRSRLNVTSNRNSALWQ